MKMLLITIVILIPVASYYGQKTNKQSGTNPVDTQAITDPYAQNLPEVTLPSHKDSWAIQILTRGGFSGRGRGDLLITSSGHISVTEHGAEHSSRLSASSREDIARLVSEVKLSGSPVNRNSLCNDCFVTVFALYRREPGGVQRRLTSVWDDSTFAGLAPELKRLYSAAMQAREDAEKKWKKN